MRRERFPQLDKRLHDGDIVKGESERLYQGLKICRTFSSSGAEGVASFSITLSLDPAVTRNCPTSLCNTCDCASMLSDELANSSEAAALASVIEVFCSIVAACSCVAPDMDSSCRATFVISVTICFNLFPASCDN